MPAPPLTVTIESKADGSDDDEIHVHAGGQGFWIARLVAELGVEVVLCGSFGGETGRVAKALITDEGVACAASPRQGATARTSTTAAPASEWRRRQCTATR